MAKDKANHPTPYPDINTLLQELLSNAQAILSDHFASMYLSGSLASGDFVPDRSDIDFVIITADELPESLLAPLAAMHARITASGKWAAKLEGDYIPQHALRRYDPAHARYPHLGVDGHFDVEQHKSDGIIQRHILREHGVVIAGPDPHSLIDPVSPESLQQAVVGILREWWAPQLVNPVQLRSREYQAYAVLTMCRALYTLQHGTIVPKSIAARWAQKTLGEQWTTLIEQALAWPHGPQPDSLNKMLDFIQYTLSSEQVKQL